MGVGGGGGEREGEGGRNPEVWLATRSERQKNKELLYSQYYHHYLPRD